MTIIYNAITDSWAFQISDRLLTRDKRSGVENFDTVSNKTVIYVAKDGVVSISYAGTAYIGEITTDRWIAETMHGESLQEGNDFKLFSANPNEQNLNFAIVNLVKKLNGVWESIPTEQKKADIGISITGWQLTKSKPRIKPVLWWLIGDGTKTKPFKRKASKRFWAKRMLATNSIGVQLPQKDLDQIKDVILQERKTGTEITAESSIVDSLRNVCSSYKTVGSDFLSVRISLGSTASIFVKYFPDPDKTQPESPRKAPVTDRTGMMIEICDDPNEIPKSPPDIESRDVYFSPWIISASTVNPPSSVIGTNTLSIGSNISVTIIGPEGSNGLLGGFISQSRPERP